MAFVVLTAGQKEELISNPQFAFQVKWAILDKADYWSNHDGTAAPGGLERWRKAKGFAKQVQKNPLVSHDSINIILFLEYMKNDQCVDNSISPYVAQNSIDRLLATSRFDAASDAWFDGQISQTL